MAVREISCQEIVELVTDYLEGSLPRGEVKAFEAHLAGCVNCTNYLDQMQQAMRLTGRLTEEALEPELRSRLLEAFRDFKRSGGEEADGDTNGGKPDDL
jgi:predicted anti-sigma-YlaC factor YlaD